MSSKAEKTSHHSYHQPRLSIFFRNPLLLKIVAWLGSLSVIGSTGVVLALTPMSTSQAEAQALPNASASAEIAATGEGQIYGPYLPITQTQSPIRFAPAQLPNREVPIAVAPASASISPTGKIVRPQHTDLLTAEHYTVGVNSDLAQITTAEFVNLPVPAPLSTIIPSQIREIVTTTRSQIQPSYVATSTVSRSARAASIQPQATAASSNSYRVVPTVVSLPAAKSISPRLDRSRAVSTAPQRPTISTPGTPLAVITPMKSPAMGTLTAQSEPRSTDIITADLITAGSIEILVPAPKTQRIEVQPVARLPQISEIKTVPVISTIPSVRPSQSPVAFSNTGQNELSELIYPLSAPAPTTSSFGWRTHPITGSRRFHSGVDIGAPTGAPVVAAGSGTIVSSGWLGGYGKAIVVQHNGVQQTLYGHLSEIFVQPGQIVEQGTVIGRVGSTGNSTGPHLHYETKVATPDGWIAVDPGENIKYALANLRRSMPFAQRDLPPGYN